MKKLPGQAEAPADIARRLAASPPRQVAVVDRDPALWARFIDDKDIIGPMIDAGRELVVTVSDDPQVVTLAGRGKVEADFGPLDGLPRYTADGFSHPAAAPPPAEPTQPGGWTPVEPPRLRRGDAEALDAGELWLEAGLEGAEDPAAFVAGQLGVRTFTRFDLAESIASLINFEAGAAEDEVATASGAKVLVDRAWLEDVRRMLHGAGARGLLDALLDRARGVVAENYESASAPRAERGSAERPAASPPSREDRGGRPPQERRPSTSRLPPDMLAAASEARSLAQELQGSRLSLEAQTGYSFDARGLEAACSALERVLDALGAAPSGGVEVQGYDPADTHRLERLLGLLRSLLRRRRPLEDAGVNPYPLQRLREDVAEFLQAIRAAGPYDVLQRRAILDMASGDDNDKRAGRVAERLTKVAIQLAKGNLRATKGGTITIDPGPMNCPVVREMIRELPSKASDMDALRKRLEDLGMLVTQGDRGQLQVYCLTRTEGEGGARTKMCQWFTDAHGNDGKFKIECAKN
jgi:hypothetical protein